MLKLYTCTQEQYNKLPDKENPEEKEDVQDDSDKESEEDEEK